MGDKSNRMIFERSRGKVLNLTSPYTHILHLISCSEYTTENRNLGETRCSQDVNSQKQGLNSASQKGNCTEKLKMWFSHR